MAEPQDNTERAQMGAADKARFAAIDEAINGNGVYPDGHPWAGYTEKEAQQFVREGVAPEDAQVRRLTPTEGVPTGPLTTGSAQPSGEPNVGEVFGAVVLPDATTTIAEGVPVPVIQALNPAAPAVKRGK